MYENGSSYDEIAARYDNLFQNVAAMESEWYGRIEKLFGKPNTIEPSFILDLCCGTGLLTRAILDLGYSVIAIDSSLEMIREAKRIRPPDSYPVIYQHGDVAECIEALNNNDCLGFVCGGSSILHLPTKTIKRMALSLANLVIEGGRGIIDIFDWDLCDQDVWWTPRCFHHFQDGRVNLTLEVFSPGDAAVSTTIIELEGSVGSGWNSRVSNFNYFRHSPSSIASIFEEVGFSSVADIRPCATGETIIRFQRGTL